MPIFNLNKLVRDGLRESYEQSDQQAEYVELTTAELKKKLIDKIIEEVVEIPLDGTPEQVAAEGKDFQQAFNDLMTLCGVTPEQLEIARQRAFDQKGGFLGGTYVGKLKLKDDDPWVEYYRKEPDRFPEEK